VHCGNKNIAIIDVSGGAALLDAVGDIDDFLTLLCVKGEIIRVRFHGEQQLSRVDGVLYRL
jgi:hypothetical protein